MTAIATKETVEKPFVDSDFKQQRLPSFFPEHSTSTIAFALIAVVVAFIPIGSAIVVYSDGLFEIDIRYDDVNKYRYSNAGGLYSYTFNGTSATQGKNCKKLFTLTKTVKAPVYLYYRLVNFHQNYRKYAASIDNAQLLGGSSDPIADCAPFRNPGELAPGALKPREFYSPCGAIAWSMFNDSIALYKVTSSTPIDTTSPILPSNVALVCDGGAFSTTGSSTVVGNLCRKSGIALDADVDLRFKAPSPTQANASWVNGGTTGSADPFRAAGYYFQEAGHAIPLSTDEDFLVWARTASLPDFWKLYRVVTSDLVAGDYLLDIKEVFDVVSFEGEKHVVLATRTWIGGKNYVLGIALIVVGALAFAMVVGALVMKFAAAL